MMPDDLNDKVRSIAKQVPNPQKFVEDAAREIEDWNRPIDAAEISAEMQKHRLACWLWMHAVEGWAFCDREGVIRLANQSLSAMTGYSTSDLAGMSLNHLAGNNVHPSPPYIKVFDELIAGQRVEFTATVGFYSRMRKKVNANLRIVAPRGGDWCLAQVQPYDVMDVFNLPETIKQQVIDVVVARSVRNNWKKITLGVVGIGGVFNTDRIIEILSQFFGG